MKCTNFREQADLLIDDEISPTAKKQFEMHLSECQLCRLKLEELQSVKKAIKISLPATPSRQFDQRVMMAFSEKQKQLSKKKAFDWRCIFISVFYPRPTLAFAAVFFVLGIFSAFQIGKLAAIDVQIDSAPAEVVTFSSPEIKESLPTPAPITKIVEVPVIKEKVITRVVYVEREKPKNIQAETGNSKLLEKTTLNNSIAKNDYLTDLNLQGFQPASEVTATVIKGESNGKK